jgi:hypothetical protein
MWSGCGRWGKETEDGPKTRSHDGRALPSKRRAKIEQRARELAVLKERSRTVKNAARRFAAQAQA